MLIIKIKIYKNDNTKIVWSFDFIFPQNNFI